MLQPTSNFPLKTRLLLASFLFSSFLLTACGSAQVSLSVSTENKTPTAVATLTSTATPYPTYTAAATYTPFPTLTVAPTATPIPTPTPVPIPTKLLIGTNSQIWGEILRYQPSTTEKLELVSLSPDLKKALVEWFKDAQNLGFVSDKLGNDKNKFVLKLDSGFVQRILIDSSPELNTPVTLTGGLYGSNTRVTIGWATNLSHMLPNALLQLIVQINFSFYVDIDRQLVALREDVSKIKDFLEQQELSKVRGTLEYLQGMQNAVAKQKLQPQDAQIFRNQLENIEKDSLQALDFSKSQMEKAETRFKQINLDKQLFVFRNEDALDKLKVEVDDFRRYSYNYLVALTARGLAAQLRCVLPGSKDLASDLLESSRQKLTDWKKAQTTFYNSVDSRIKEMDGWFADDKKPAQFRDAVQKGRLDAETKSTDLDKIFITTIAQVANYNKFAINGLDLVVELDTNGEIKQIYRVVKA